MKFHVEGMPDNLPDGQYATRVKKAEWVNQDIEITLEFKGELDPNDLSLYTIYKGEDEVPTKPTI